MPRPTASDPDAPPKLLLTGAINPFALAEALLHRKLDWSAPATRHRILPALLQTDYDELFDMRFRSVLYAGVRINNFGGVERVPEEEVRIFCEGDGEEEEEEGRDDLSGARKLGDLKRMIGLGGEEIEELGVKRAVVSNGNLHVTLVLSGEVAGWAGRRMSCEEMTAEIMELATPYRRNSLYRQPSGEKEEELWTPPGGRWMDVSAWNHRDVTMFTNPVQGAAPNSWFVAALMSVDWAEPGKIERCVPKGEACQYMYPEDFNDDNTEGLGALETESVVGENYGDYNDTNNPRPEEKPACTLATTFYSQGGDNDAPTAKITVDCVLPTNSTTSLLVYCRPSSLNYAYPPTLTSGDWRGELWPALYEKAFAVWLSTGKKTVPSESSCMINSSPALSATTPDSNFDPPDGTTSPTSSSPATSETAESNTAASLLPDLVLTCQGDPVKALAQLTSRPPMYFHTSCRTATDLLALVRLHSSNLRVTTPMVAWTRPTSDDGAFCRGATLVGNMAYSVLGWATRGSAATVGDEETGTGLSRSASVRSMSGMRECELGRSVSTRSRNGTAGSELECSVSVRSMRGVVRSELGRTRSVRNKIATAGSELCRSSSVRNRASAMNRVSDSTLTRSVSVRNRSSSFSSPPIGLARSDSTQSHIGALAQEHQLTRHRAASVSSQADDLPLTRPRSKSMGSMTSEMVRRPSLRSRTNPLSNDPDVIPENSPGQRSRPSTPTRNQSLSIGNPVVEQPAKPVQKQFIVLRHPWGVTPPLEDPYAKHWPTSPFDGDEVDGAKKDQEECPYGVIVDVDEDFWPPVATLDETSVFAVEISVFKEYFAGLGLAK